MKKDIRGFMGNKDADCFGYFARARAYVALIFPFGVILAAILALGSNGYSWRDYITLVLEGEISFIRQGVGVLAILYWVARYWPSAIEAISSEDRCLIRLVDGEIRLANGKNMPVSELVDLRRKRTILKKGVEFYISSGSVVYCSTMFSEGRGYDIIEVMRNRIFGNSS